MTRSGAYLAAAARSLRAMQLPTGELPAVRWSGGEASYAPSPLLCALAYDALAFVDVRSPLFVGRVRDLVPPSFFGDIVTLRWGLRLFLASEQSANGTWQLHGRLGARDADVATTACAAAALLPSGKWRTARVDARHAAALRECDARDATTLGAAHALRYFALTGENAPALLARVARDAEEPLSAAAMHAIASAFRAMAIQRALPVPEMADDTLAAALVLAARLDLDDADGSALDGILRSATSPSHWPADPYDEQGIGSPAVTLALCAGNVARLAALPRGEA